MSNKILYKPIGDMNIEYMYIWKCTQETRGTHELWEDNRDRKNGRENSRPLWLWYWWYHLVQVDQSYWRLGKTYTHAQGFHATYSSIVQQRHDQPKPITLKKQSAMLSSQESMYQTNVFEPSTIVPLNAALQHSGIWTNRYWSAICYFVQSFVKYWL